MSKRKTLTDKEHQTIFEYETFPECTVVALDAPLSYFAAQPITQNGTTCVRFNDRTIKDCTRIDGCIYMHKGCVPDNVMVDLIEKFNKLKAESKDWKTKGRIILPNTKITI